VILDELVTLLVADSDVNDLIAGRIYTSRAPDNTSTPYCVQHLLIEQRLTVLEGAAASNNPARVQIDCWADGVSEAKDLSDKVETALVGASTFEVGDLSRHSDYEPDSKLYRFLLDVSLWT
jgi:hypothetical protein